MSFTNESYKKLYAESIKNPGKFWEELGKKELFWFPNNKTNISYNCLDRHIKAGGGEKVAYIWTNEKNDEIKITYKELLKKVNQIGNYLDSLGLGKGDTLTIYMPLTIEQIASMLACTRLGIIHSVVYAGFSWEALKSRIDDAQSRFIITSDFTYRRGKAIDLLSTVREAVKKTTIEKILIFKREEGTILGKNEVDLVREIEKESETLEPVRMDPEDPLFILYTSGTTGKPKGILHATGGYNLYAHVTTKYTFDTDEHSIFWCTADIGWITGHSYVVYGPLSNHLTTILYEGVPDYPAPDAWWKIIEKYGVTVFYTSPTAIRMLMTYGEKIPQEFVMTCLKVIGSVGEPLNITAWEWFNKYVGKNRCPLVDTWWQTETGGHMITTLPGVTTKPGYAGLPYFGFEAKIVNEDGKEMAANKKGYLVISGSWPGILRACWHNNARYEEYFNKIKGYFFTGDMAVKDKDGYIRILGRTDDTINLAGHTISSAEIESALCTHEKVAEAGVVGVPDEIKGEKIIAFVTLIKGIPASESLKKEIIKFVGEAYGKFARPEEVWFVEKLPKTRSGKIMRRVLRAEVTGKDVGDTSTLE